MLRGSLPSSPDLVWSQTPLQWTMWSAWATRPLSSTARISPKIIATQTRGLGSSVGIFEIDKPKTVWKSKEKIQHL